MSEVKALEDDALTLMLVSNVQMMLNESRRRMSKDGFFNSVFNFNFTVM